MLPVLLRTLFVPTIPVPASPSGGAIKLPPSSLPLASSNLAPSSVKEPAFSPALKTVGKISLTFQSYPATFLMLLNLSNKSAE